MRVLHVDSFTDAPFRGNPAGVVLLDEPREAGWMQAVAAELNLPETAFLEATDDPAVFGLRWFSPTVEVDLCGHATLASAHALWQAGSSTDRLRFTTRSGELTAERADGGIVLNFPTDPPHEVEQTAADRVAAALGTAPRWTGRGRDKFLALLDDEDAVRKVDPDFVAVRGLDAMGVIVTAPADAGPSDSGPSDSGPSDSGPSDSGRADAGTPDFVSRFFAPSVGIDEDPVTGAAHCCLAPFWTDRLGARPLLGYQASARGGFVGVELDGERVRLSGRAVTVLRSEMD